MPFEQPASSFTAQPQNSDSLFADFWKSAVHGAVEAPVTALGQLVDKNFDWEPVKPCDTKTGSVDYFVQGIGGAAGLVTDFAVLKGGIGQFGKTGLAADLHLAVLRNPLGLTAVTGGLYGGLLTPTDPKYGNQFESRLKNAALTAGTFTAMEGLSTKLAPLTKSDSKIGGIVKTIGINAGAGVPIGMLNTQAESLLFEHKLAGLNQIAQAGVDWGVIGGALAVPVAIRSATSDGIQLESKASATTKDGTSREFKVVAGAEDLDAFRRQGKAGVMLKVRVMTDSGAGIKRSLWVQHGNDDIAPQARQADFIAMCNGEKLPNDLADKHVMAAKPGDLYLNPGSKDDRISFDSEPKPLVNTKSGEPIKLDTASVLAPPFESLQSLQSEHGTGRPPDRYNPDEPFMALLPGDRVWSSEHGEGVVENVYSSGDFDSEPTNFIKFKQPDGYFSPFSSDSKCYSRRVLIDESASHKLEVWRKMPSQSELIGAAFDPTAPLEPLQNGDTVLLGSYEAGSRENESWNLMRGSYILAEISKLEDDKKFGKGCTLKQSELCDPSEFEYSHSSLMSYRVSEDLAMRARKRLQIEQWKRSQPEAAQEYFKELDARWRPKYKELFNEFIEDESAEQALNKGKAAIAERMLTHKIEPPYNNREFDDLRRADLHEIDISGARLRGSNLSQAILDYCKASGADLSNANLMGTKMRRGDFSDVNFARTSGGADLTGSFLMGARFDGADLKGFRLDSAILDDVDLSGQRLQQVNAKKASMKGTLLDQSTICKSDFAKANLQMAKMTGASIEDSDFTGTWAVDADFSNAKICGTKFDGAILRHASFENAQFDVRFRDGTISFKNADLTGANFRGADLESVKGKRIKFNGADLKGADFTGADLRGVDFTGANLKGAILIGANLEGALLKNADLNGVILDQEKHHFWETNHQIAKKRGATF